MSELETQKEDTKKELTFEEICPEWSRRIANFENLPMEKKQQIMDELRNPRICFVGEAWKGRNYDCPDCDSHMGFIQGLCGPFLNHVDLGYKFSWNEFNQRKDIFVKHWNEKHG